MIIFLSGILCNLLYEKVTIKGINKNRGELNFSKYILYFIKKMYSHKITRPTIWLNRDGQKISLSYYLLGHFMWLLVQQILTPADWTYLLMYCCTWGDWETMIGEILPGQLWDSLERDWARYIAGSSTPEKLKKNNDFKFVVKLKTY